MEEKQIEEIKETWNEAEMINQVDGEKASEELKELIEKNINEEITEEEMIEEIKEQYLKKQ